MTKRGRKSGCIIYSKSSLQILDSHERCNDKECILNNTCQLIHHWCNSRHWTSAEFTRRVHNPREHLSYIILMTISFDPQIYFINIREYMYDEIITGQAICPSIPWYSSIDFVTPNLETLGLVKIKQDGFQELTFATLFCDQCEFLRQGPDRNP